MGVEAAKVGGRSGTGSGTRIRYLSDLSVVVNIRRNVDCVGLKLTSPKCLNAIGYLGYLYGLSGTLRVPRFCLVRMGFCIEVPEVPNLFVK